MLNSRTLPLAALLAGLLLLESAGCSPQPDKPVATVTHCGTAPEEPALKAVGTKPDLSGRSRIGRASFYAMSFAHKLMANGALMNPKGNNAASRTLPLGTSAVVTNLDTGKTAIVTIADRGPYVGNRIVDLSPATASKIGLSEDKGLARVKIAPITVPLPDGTIKTGAGAPKHVVCTNSQVARLNP